MPLWQRTGEGKVADVREETRWHVWIMLLPEPDLKKHSLVCLRLWYSSTTDLEKSKKKKEKKSAF